MLRARTAVAAVFAANGVAFASFLSRTPALRDDLELSTAGLGLLLLCLSAGAVAGLPLSGPIVHRVGPARAVLGGSLAVAGGLFALAGGLLAGAVVAAAVGLAVTGLGMGVWDVAMNVEGADVERRLGRSLMPRLHAAFSLGTVGGALLGAVSAAAGLPLAVQLLAIGSVVPVVALLAVREFIAVTPAHEVPSGAGSGAATAWRERRTLVVGLLVLAFAFTEGTANDWIAVALVDGYGASEAIGAVSFGVFVAAMTVGRLFGGRALDRFGRVVVLRDDRHDRPCRPPARRARRHGWRRPGRRGALGHRRVARLPGRHERRRRRPGPRAGTGVGRRVDRLHGVPRRATADRLARGLRRHPASASRGGCRARARPPRRRRRAPAQPCSSSLFVRARSSVTSRSSPSAESGPSFAACELREELPLPLGIESRGAPIGLQRPDLAHEPEPLVDVRDDLAVVRRDPRPELGEPVGVVHTDTAAISAAPLKIAWRTIGG